MDFFAVNSVIIQSGVMCSICWLTSMELILIPNNSLLYFHSNDINNLKSYFLKIFLT